MRKICGFIIVLWLCLAFTNNAYAARESNMDFVVISSDGQNTGPLFDKERRSCNEFKAGTSLTFKASELIYGIYIEWYDVPKPYIIEYNGKSFEGAPYSFYHEFVDIEGGAKEIVFKLENDCRISNVYAFNSKEVPCEIQKWQPMCEKADILVVSTHADDEILFLGGVLAEYAGERKLDVQVIYFFDYLETWREREHERLDGLWAIGVRHYPDSGEYKEASASSIDSCKKQYNFETSVGWMTEKIRRYKPLVCVTQDVNGEYGHPHHKYVVNVLQTALEISGDESGYPESAKEYGIYDVPKTYIHLWPENKIKLDTRKPLQNFGGKTAFDMASAAYMMHVTQHEFWFYVSDDNNYSIADYGLYRSKVGLDTSNDMMENLVSYGEQKRLEEESESASLEAVSKEQASKEALDKESIEETVESQIESTYSQEIVENSNEQDRNKAILIIVIAASIGIATIIITIVCLIRKKGDVK